MKHDSPDQPGPLFIGDHSADMIADEDAMLADLDALVQRAREFYAVPAGDPFRGACVMAEGVPDAVLAEARRRYPDITFGRGDVMRDPEV